ncbi:MAG: pyruvate, phosphate dikinase [Clostridia bacterium]|nr:pyruvate, phosphate dikinase [Clostridia bacterium]
MAKKYVYLFSEGNADMRNILGGKGANLAEMTNIGLPVPHGFTISTEACTQYYSDNKCINEEIQNQIFEALSKIEKQQNKKFGDNTNPYLVSVRSGARVSMPGMMDTILNLGLNDVAVEGLAKKTNNPRFAYDSYRRFIQMFSDVVMGVEKSTFEKIIDDVKTKKHIVSDLELTTDDIKNLIQQYKKVYFEHINEDFPQDPKIQLMYAVKAVFDSWDNSRAVVYRRMNDIPAEWGTAVNIQSMVFGNMGETSGTGVAFTRNPSTGEKALYGEYLMNAQGEDVVAGVRTPMPISQLKNQNPKLYDQFVEIAYNLEKHYKDMQDMEFTIEEGKLYMLQTRNGKRTAQASLQVAVDLVNEGMLTEKEALMKIEPKSLDALLHPTFKPSALKAATKIATGLPASPGAGYGKISFSAEDAKVRTQNKEKVILVRLETSPEDIEGMYSAQGIVTARGGMTSHAAVVARGMGRTCVAGVPGLIVDADKKLLIINGKQYTEKDSISIDGSTGHIYDGEVATEPASLTGNFATIMSWADKYRKLHIHTNADTPKDAEQAVKFGAEGIGLCRTEHMFFDSDRIMAMREMIVSTTEEERQVALDKLLPMQKSDFKGLFYAMKEMPVTIRFLDPPLHEFLPHTVDEMNILANQMNVKYETIKNTVDRLHEFNPMLGHRGCRLSITYPEIARMQTRAVIEAAIEVANEKGYKVHPEIMIPLVGDLKEFKYVKNIVKSVADKIIFDSKSDIKYKVGTMIEIPRAALLADEIAQEAEFFSVGTNDLTQMTFGFSRDDAGAFLGNYYDKKIFEQDPFQKLDTKGVGKLIEMAVSLGRKERPNLPVGICGEHGGDPYSISFCHNAGLTYVSCSPYRVPIARLAAAQASIKSK